MRIRLGRPVVLATMLALAGCSSGAQGPHIATKPATDKPATSAPVTPVPASSAPANPVTPTVEPVSDVMTGGLYLFGPFGDKLLTIAATGPNHWVGYPSWAMDGPEPLRADAPNGIGISFFTANGLYSDPCHWDVRGIGDAGQPGDVKVGPTVGDMVAALRANTFYTSSVPTPVTIDGYSGQELELQLPDAPYTKCDKDDPNDSGGHEFVFSGPGLYAQGRGNRWHLYMLDVEGTRLISVILSYAKTPKTDLDLARNVIETMDINP
jgi:hypothetical protein